MCVHVRMLAFQHYAEKGSDQRSPSSTKSIYMCVHEHVRACANACYHLPQQIWSRWCWLRTGCDQWSPQKPYRILRSPRSLTSLFYPWAFQTSSSSPSEPTKAKKTMLKSGPQISASRKLQNSLLKSGPQVSASTTAKKSMLKSEPQVSPSKNKNSIHSFPLCPPP